MNLDRYEDDELYSALVSAMDAIHALLAAGFPVTTPGVVVLVREGRRMLTEVWHRAAFLAQARLEEVTDVLTGDVGALVPEGVDPIAFSLRDEVGEWRPDTPPEVATDVGGQ